MSTYAIGDLQGCHAEFMDLLDRIQFDSNRDQLWLVGDLVNRGPDSLGCLRFVRELGEAAVTVLGNHDLHLLAVAIAGQVTRKKDTIQPILDAPDRDGLLHWLRCQPLLHHDSELGYTMTHAGLPPAWDRPLAQECAAEVQSVLRGTHYRTFIEHMYGNKPDIWDASLEEHERWRFTINALTRMRYCDRHGRLTLEQKGPPGTQAPHLKPWFMIDNRRNRDTRIVFGHWSTLRLSEDDYSAYNVFPLDTGCVWGGALTAMRLEDGKEFSVPSQQPAVHE